MIKTAEIYGPDDQYRGELRRIVDSSRPLLVTGMLNPSDADHERNDPTILTLFDFAARWNYGGLLVVNEHDYRSPSPAVLRTVADPTGRLNEMYVTLALQYALETTGWALAAWGNGGSNDQLFVQHATRIGVRLMCLGTTGNGSPKHPLARGTHRIPRDTLPVAWTAPA